MGFQRKFWQATRLIVPGFWVTRLLVSLVVAAVVSTGAAVVASGFTLRWFAEPPIPPNTFLTSDDLPKWEGPKSYLVRRDSLSVDESSILFRLGMWLDSTQPADPSVVLGTDPVPAAIRRRHELWWARLNERFGAAPIFAHLTVIEAGFPFRVAEGGSILGTPPGMGRFWAADFSWLRLLSADPNGFVVYGPLWLGLAGNTLCWGLPLFAALSLVELRRLRYYAKTGLCAKCNYEAAALARCPECGEQGGVHTIAG